MNFMRLWKLFFGVKKMMDDNTLIELMSRVFPGYEEYPLDSVTPSITGNNRLSFLVVCNDEAAKSFSETGEIYVQLYLSTGDNKKGRGKDLYLRLEFSFPLYQLQFFAVVEGDNFVQQQNFARVLAETDQFIIWLVDQEKQLLNVLQAPWDKSGQQEVLAEILS